jgi:hypothetical protein
MQFNAHCLKCRHRWTFTGPDVDARPACPQCGDRPRRYPDPPPPPADSPLYAKPIGENALFDEPKGEA